MPNTSIAYRIAASVGSFITHPVTQTAASLAFGFYGGPIASIAARSAFPAIYSATTGSVPTMASLSYWAVYAPAREHFVSKAFIWGPRLAAAAAPVVNTGVRYLVGSLWSTQAVKEKEAESIEASQVERIAVAPAV